MKHTPLVQDILNDIEQSAQGMGYELDNKGSQIRSLTGTRSSTLSRIALKLIQ
jgi:hypothetical protein